MKKHLLSLLPFFALSLCLHAQSFSFTSMAGKTFIVKAITHANGTTTRFEHFWEYTIYNFLPAYNGFRECQYFSDLRRDFGYVKYDLTASKLTIRDGSNVPEVVETWSLAGYDAKTSTLKVKTNKGDVLEGTVRAMPQWGDIGENVHMNLSNYKRPGFPGIANMWKGEFEYIKFTGLKKTGPSKFTYQSMLWKNIRHNPNWPKEVKPKFDKYSHHNRLFASFPRPDGGEENLCLDLAYYDAKDHVFLVIDGNEAYIFFDPTSEVRKAFGL